MTTVAEDTARGLGVGGMFAIGLASLFLFWIGSYLEGLGSASGVWIMVASGAGMVTSWVAGKAMATGRPRRAAIVCAAQAGTALALLVWWTATDAWRGFRYTGTVPLLAVLVVDAIVLVWAVGWLRVTVREVGRRELERGRPGGKLGDGSAVSQGACARRFEITRRLPGRSDTTGRLRRHGSARAPGFGCPSMRILALAAVAAVVFPAVFAGATAAEASARDREAPRPNIVLVVADDQRWDALDEMPTVTGELSQYGVTFTNSFTVNPQCCPSRASLMTGRYSHSTGVYANGGPHGGFRAFDDSTTLATALDEVGYTTGLFGKYLNGYGGRRATRYVPPGWDAWSVFHGGTDGYYRYRLARGRRVTSYGGSAEDYSTTVLARQAAAFVRKAKEPFFLELAPYAPHAPALMPPERGRVFVNTPWSPAVSFGEGDVTDKPAYIRRLRALTAQDIRDTERFRRRQLLASLGVDDAVRLVLDELDARGLVQSTVIVYTSDNGVAWGEHLLAAGRKAVPYEEQIRVPLVVRYDPITQYASRADDHLVLNVDIAPTLARLAGATLPGAEGRSLLRLLHGRQPSAWRSDFLVEHLAGGTRWHVPTYCAVRTGRFKYVLYGTLEEELYDLARDPHELRNLAGAPETRALQRRLSRRLRTLCSPAPPGYRALADIGGRRRGR